MNLSLVEFVTTSVVSLSVWIPTDLVRTLTGHSVLDVLSTAFTGDVVFPPFGDHPDSLNVRQFLPRLHLLDPGSSWELRTSSEGCTVVTTTVGTRHLFTSAASVVVLNITSAAVLFASSGWSSMTKLLAFVTS